MSEQPSDAPPMTPVERAIALRRVEAFRRVPLDQLAELAAVAVERVYPAGSRLFREGDPSDSLFLILEGDIRLQRQGRDLGEAGAGETLGAWALFEDRPRRGTARVTTEARVLVLERDDFYEVLSDHIEITRSLIRHLVGRLLELTGMEDEAPP